MPLLRNLDFTYDYVGPTNWIIADCTDILINTGTFAQRYNTMAYDKIERINTCESTLCMFDYVLDCCNQVTDHVVYVSGTDKAWM